MRRPFTLIEGGVVVLVAAVAAGLALPSLRAAQDEARAQGCLDNLKMLGLALHNYHAVNQSLPISSLSQGGLGLGHSGFAALLPYLEHAPVYNTYNFWLPNWHRANATTVRTRVDLFLCPDNDDREPTPAAAIRTVDGQSYGGTSTFAANHYGMNWGGGRAGWGEQFDRQYEGGFRGLLLAVPAQGPDGPTRTVAFADVHDGLAFTIAIAEKRAGRGWAVGGWAGSEFDAHTGPRYDGDDPLARRVYPGSTHAEGTHVLMGDGSARSLRPALNGAVWFALLTRASGEVIPPNALD